MSKIFLFSGTSEGRELSEYLSENQILHIVFVATDYGKVVMKDSEYARIKSGRLTESEMREFFLKEKPDMVLDATHPYAVEVSQNIRNALGNQGRYIRISRELASSSEILREAGNKTRVTIVDSTQEAIEHLKKSNGTIMLTTGVKTLKAYASVESLKERLIARILPSKESLGQAIEAGLEPRQIIAMEGPFTASLNEAMIDQHRALVLVTKNSGSRGGFPEKVEACVNRKIELLVIEPEEKAVEDGMSISQVKTLLTGSKRFLTIVGIGAGDDKSLTLEACKRIKEAGLLIGAERMLEIGSRMNPKAETLKEYNKEQIIRNIRERGYEKNVYLVSGDTGFFSGASAFKGLEEENLKDIKLEILPGISSISYLCAGLGISYSNARLVSSHGRQLDYKTFLSEHESFFAITSGKEDCNSIAQGVIDFCKNEGSKELVYICIGFNLGRTDQKILKYELENYVPAKDDGLYVLGVIYGQ